MNTHKNLLFYYLRFLKSLFTMIELPLYVSHYIQHFHITETKQRGWWTLEWGNTSPKAADPEVGWATASSAGKNVGHEGLCPASASEALIALSGAQGPCHNTIPLNTYNALHIGPPSPLVQNVATYVLIGTLDWGFITLLLQALLWLSKFLDEIQSASFDLKILTWPNIWMDICKPAFYYINPGEVLAVLFLWFIYLLNVFVAYLTVGLI